MKNYSWVRYVFVAVIFLGILYFVYYKPKNTELKNIKKERVNIEQEVSTLRAKKKQLDKIEVEIEQMNTTLKGLETIIPQKKETSDILNRIQELAYDSQLNLVKLAPRTEVNKEFYSEWPIPIEITGNYHNLALFFDRLSGSSRIFNIENFTLKALSKQTDSSTISATFTAKTYFLPEENTAPEKSPQKPSPNKPKVNQ